MYKTSSISQDVFCLCSFLYAVVIQVKSVRKIFREDSDDMQRDLRVNICDYTSLAKHDRDYLYHRRVREINET